MPRFRPHEAPSGEKGARVMLRTTLKWLVTGTVWFTALATAGGLAYALNRPLTPRIVPEPPAVTAAEPDPGPLPPLSYEREDPAPAVVVAPIVIAGARKAAASARPAPRTAFKEMKCGEWRELQAGSGKV